MSSVRLCRLVIRTCSIAFLSLLACSATLSAQTLMWNANPESNMAGYIVQYGTQSGSPSTSVDVGNVTSRQFSSLAPGSTYYFRVVAYNTAGQQSTPSSQVSYVVPITPPVVPTLTGLSPTSGPTAGGTVITIAGTNFAAGATVSVGGAAASAVTYLSSSQLRATTPAGTAGARTVQVTNPSGQSASAANAFTYTAQAGAPTLTSVSPASGPTAGGTVITVNGTNFVSGATVRVDGIAASAVTFLSATQVRATTPAGTAGAKTVQVTNPSGASASLSNGFTYSNSTGLSITSITPSSGPTAGNTPIVILGTNFVGGGNLYVSIGGEMVSSLQLISSTEIRGRTPSGSAGAKNIRFTNGNSQFLEVVGGYTYTNGSAPAPTFTSVSPTTGSTAGGTVITLSGANFVSGATVRVDGVAATGVTFVSSTQLRATTPAGTAGAKTVQVTNPSGQSVSLANAFTYTSPSTPAPTLTSVSPASGPTAGGTVITVTGSNFVSGATVRVDGVAASAVTFLSATQVRATSPAGTAGAKTVQVTNPSGQSASLANGFTYTASASMTLTSVSPASGPTAGGTVVTLTGTSLVSGSTVRVDGVAATAVTYVSATQLRATTPAGTAGAKTVQITNPSGQSASLANGFTYTSGTTLSITSISPNSGPTAGNTAVVIQGANFVGGGNLYVSLGGEPLTGLQLVSSTELRGRTPARSAGVKNLRFTNGNGQFLEIIGAFTYSNSSALTAETETAAARSAGDDSDNDGLPTEWEQGYGLDANSATGADGAAGDADGDGVSNLDEYSLGSHPRGLVRRYLAEGAVTDQMETSLSLANAEAVSASVVLTFSDANGQTTRLPIDVPARSRREVDLRTVPELVGMSFSTTLESDQVVGLDRLVSWAGGVASSLETAVEQPSTHWVFAEGATGSPFELFYLVQNPGTTAADVQVRYLLPGGNAPISKTYTVAAESRATIWVNREDPALSRTEVAADITSVNGAPIVVERSLYLTDARTGLPRSGETSAGVMAVDAVSGNGTTKADARWLLAAAELGGDRQASTSLAVVNQGAATDVTVTLLFEDGPEASTTFAAAAGAHLTVPLEQAFPMAVGRRFSILIEGGDASARLAVDRAISWQAADGTRTAGTDGAVTRQR